MSYIICPKCKELLIKNENTYKCINNHSYDISKRGYINLLLANQMNSSNPGDNKEMMLARKLFLEKGYYNKLRDELAKYVMNVSNGVILDIGCGEGYYTNFLATNTSSQVIGIDISKSMINEASKKLKDHDNLSYLIASINNLPIKDNSVDVIINCFAPIDVNEIKRVLKDDGILVKITPADYHLFELKEVLYENPYLNPEDDEIKELTLIDKNKIEYKMDLKSQEDINSLFVMTPYYYKTKEDAKLKLQSLSSLEVRASFTSRVYKK